jgi:hypothetical protein
MPEDPKFPNESFSELRRERSELGRVEVVSEILFGLIMALTFTCTLR